MKRGFVPRTPRVFKIYRCPCEVFDRLEMENIVISLRISAYIQILESPPSVPTVLEKQQRNLVRFNDNQMKTEECFSLSSPLAFVHRRMRQTTEVNCFFIAYFVDSKMRRERNSRDAKLVVLTLHGLRQ